MIHLSVADKQIVVPPIEQILSKNPQVSVKRLTCEYFHGDGIACATIVKFLTEHLDPIQRKYAVFQNVAGSAVDFLVSNTSEEAET